MLNVSWKFAVDRRERLAEALPRRLVDALDRLGWSARSSRSDPCAAWSGTAWRGLELVELLDGHHVHRDRGDRSCAQRRRSLPRRRARCVRRHDGGIRTGRSVPPAPRPSDGGVSRSSSSSGSSAASMTSVGRRLPSRSSCSTSTTTSSSVALTASSQVWREVRQIGLRRSRARHRARRPRRGSRRARRARP